VKSSLAKEKLPNFPSSSLFKMRFDVGDAEFNERAITEIENGEKKRVTF